MRNGSYYTPRDRIHPFFNPGSMNNEEGLYVYWETDPVVARRVLPPQFELLDPAHPVVAVYVVDIREPTFAPWYMEGGIYLLCRYGDRTGAYFLNLQLSGPGAPMGLSSGREFSGLPKKLCERIAVERTGDWARAWIEAKGRRIFDVEVRLGEYNEPATELLSGGARPEGRVEGSCFLFRTETARAPEGHMTLDSVDLIHYDSVTDYQSWEPATITSLGMEPSLDDPWAEMVVVRLLGAAYSVNSNWVRGTSRLARLEGEDADSLFPYVFSGKWDQSTLGPAQRYGQY